MIWNNCVMSYLYYTKHKAEESIPCIVKIDENQIIVEYDDDGLCQYIGPNDGSGHFELDMQGYNGRATLHRFPDGLMLEGSWIEDGEKGMWRIELLQ
ncbi:MAG TPA: hypothetical protein PKZ27_17625 [Rhodocyclaceae bacterium]|nr:hypothetical protein [Rhodocyclaceae bacterium]